MNDPRFATLKNTPLRHDAPAGEVLRWLRDNGFKPKGYTLGRTGGNPRWPR